MPRSPISLKAQQFTESVIREMTRLALDCGAVNLAQGFPDFPAPGEVKEAAVNAIRADINQYAITWGAREFRRAIAERFAQDTGLAIDPEWEITVCCGATEAMIASLLAVVNPGDEVVVFEPFYENYGPDAIICGAQPRFVSLHPPDWSFDPQELASAFSERTITINGMSKTYAVTGWRVGYAIAPPQVSDAIRKMHDFLTVGAAAPLQEAGATALRLPEAYYRKLGEDYVAKRDRLMAGLEQAGFRCYKPHGAYYLMTDISGFGFPNDVEFARHLVEEVGVAVVPGSSFYRHPSRGAQQVRFAFCKSDATLCEAARRLERLAINPSPGNREVM